MRDNKKGRNAKGYYPNIDLVWLRTWLRRKRSDWYDSALWWFWGSGKIIERVVQPKEKTENEENHKGKVSGMDAAMVHRERKQLNFSTIVDFSFSKQGIFFVLEWRGFEQPVPAAAGRKSARWAVCEGAGESRHSDHKPVTKKMSQAFFFAVSLKNGDFANWFLDTVLQCCPTILGRFSQLNAHFSCRFLEFGRGAFFFEKNRINPTVFSMFSMSRSQFPVGSGNFLLFPAVFSLFSGFLF